MGEALLPVNSEEPKLSTSSPIVGSELSASNGKWTNSPLAYSYQWLDCNPEGGECKAIPGATNETYRPVMSDVGHALMVEVHAINAAGVSTASPLNSPTGDAVDSKGDLWVAESGKNRIQEFSPSGEALRQFGFAGTGNGQFKSPSGIALDAAGDVFVADRDNNRIQEFSSSGEYVRQFGVKGGENGQFKEPSGVTVESKGNVWVADTGNNRLQEFSSTGTYITQIKTTHSWPMDLAVDGSEHIWVTEGIIFGTNAVGEYSFKGELIRTFGTEGTGAGQFTAPWGIAIDGSGNVWVGDTGNNRIQKFSSNGSYLTQYEAEKPEGVAFDAAGNMWVSRPTNLEKLSSSGEYVTQIGSWASVKAVKATGTPTYTSQVGVEGTGNSQFKRPYALAMDVSNDVFVADTKNNRVQEFSSSGEYVRQFGVKGTENGQLKEPYGIAVDGKGNLWIADTENSRVQEFSVTGSYIKQFKAAHAEPVGIAVDSSEHVWVTEGYPVLAMGATVTEYTTGGEALRSFGSEGKGNGQFNEAWGIAIDSNGNVWVADRANNRIQKFSSTGSYLAQYTVERPAGLTIDSSGDLWITRPSSVEELYSNGAYLASFGSSGTGEGQFKEPSGIDVGSNNRIWIADTLNNRLQQFTIPAVSEESGSPPKPNPGSNSVTTIEYGVALSGSELPNMTAGEIEKGWAQKDAPAEATAIFPPDEAQGWPAKDYKRATIYYRDKKGRNVNVATPSGAIATSEYNETNDVTRTLTPDNRLAALKEGAKSAEASTKLDTQSTYNTEGSELTSTLGPRHAVKLPNGKEAQARSYTSYKYDEGVPTEGGPYHLLTRVAQGAIVEGEPEQDERITTDTYSGQANLGWKLRRPTSITTYPTSLKMTRTTLYDSTTGNVTETRSPASKGSGEPHDTVTIYYTAAANSAYPACGEHAYWANLPCETLPGKQPETPGVPNLPVATVTYNMYLQPVTITGTVGANTRTTTLSYDEAGRQTSSQTTSTVGAALPAVTTKYNTSNGALSEQSTTVEGKTQTITQTLNTLGQMIAYTDADGNTTTYQYETEKDARLKQINDGKGTQTPKYDETTGLVKELVDSAAGTFTASYDTEGNMASESYPNSMSANYTLNALAQPTSVQYVKNVNCAKTCPETWYSDTVVPSIHGQWGTQTSSTGTESYTDAAAGRLTQVQQTPTGKGCTTRIYAYDEETNRLSLTIRPPGSEGKCATEGGTVETHTYDPANRITDTGTSYNAFGNTTKLPAADAGGTELTSSFYVDDQLASQTQNGQTVGENLDPTGRIRETVSTGKITATEIQHYLAPGNTPSWSWEPSGNTTRNITGIDGSLAAIQHNAEAPLLQLVNLHGDIVGTAYDSSTATALASTITEASEYGVPATEAPPKYYWLGAHEIPTQLPSGVIAMGARSYVPQLGRFLQTDPVSGGSANPYAYTNADPLNETDLSGMYDATVSATIAQALNKEAEEAAAKAAAAEAAARVEAERKAAEAAAQAEAYAGVESEGEEGPEEYEEEGEEWGEEYAAFGPGPGVHAQAHAPQPTQTAEGGVYFQEGEGQAAHGLSERLCKAAGEGPCVHFAQGCFGPKYGCGRPGQRRTPYHNTEPTARPGRRKGGHGGRDTPGNVCRTVAGATAPLAVASGPGGVALWVIGFATCYAH
jgi:RHS repeat-associated protein